MRNSLYSSLLFLLIFLSFGLQAATQPTFSIEALTPTVLKIPNNGEYEAQYQVTNNTKISRTLTIVPIDNIPIVSSGSNSCQIPFVLAPQQSCTLTLNLIGNQLGNGIVWPKICKVNYNNQNPDPFLCSQSSFSDTLNISIVEPAIQTAAGVQGTTAPYAPLLMQSTNGGNDWEVVTLGSEPTGGQFFNTTCKGSGSSAFCLAAGGMPDGVLPYTVPPFITQSSDGGATWASKTISNAPALGNLYGADCNENAQLCVGVGDEIIYSGATITQTPPLVVQTLDYGANWAVKSLSGSVPTNASFISASCLNQYCVGSGQIASSAGDLASKTNNPFLAQTVNGGGTWSVVSVPGAPEFGYFYHVNCTENNGNILCATVGQNYDNTTPTVAQTTNGGADWSMVSVPLDSPGTGYLNDIHCSGSICVGVGASITDSSTYLPLLFQTVDGGANWSVIDIDGIEAITNGMLYTVHCTGSGTDTICISGGANYVTEKPVLVQTINGGTTWSVVSISGAPLGFFNTVSCTGQGPTAVCNAVGEDDTAGLSSPVPLIAQSTNGGALWSILDTASLPNIPGQGVLYWSAATGGE
ncbi:MAG: hypothetical protein NXI01_04540 [Gammaproteobacteria bacterium]|nr:hypothetical protein [Gammaproteobacteria bacterium]